MHIRYKILMFNLTPLAFWKITPSFAQKKIAPEAYIDIQNVLILKGCRMGRSDKGSLWYVSLLINTRFRFFILE